MSSRSGLRIWRMSSVSSRPPGCVRFLLAPWPRRSGTATVQPASRSATASGSTVSCEPSKSCTRITVARVFASSVGSYTHVARVTPSEVSRSNRWPSAAARAGVTDALPAANRQATDTIVTSRINPERRARMTIGRRGIKSGGMDAFQGAKTGPSRLSAGPQGPGIRYTLTSESIVWSRGRAGAALPPTACSLIGCHLAYESDAASTGVVGRRLRR